MAVENDEKSRRNVWLLVSIIAGTLGAVSDGMHFGFSSVIFQPYNELLHNQNISNASQDQQNETFFLKDVSDQMLFKTFYMLGAMAGCFISVPFLNGGPKITTKAASVVSLISWILLAATTSLSTIFVARVLAGISITLTLSTSTTYISEITNQKLAESLKGVVYYALLLGILFIYLLSPAFSYIVSPIIGAIIMLLQLVISFLMIESPYYLISRNKITEARVNLMKLRSVVSIEEELETIQVKILKENREKRDQRLFNTNANRHASIKIIVTSFIQQFAGITVLIMSLHEILHEAYIPVVHSATTGIGFIACIGLSGILSELKIVKRNSRNEYFSCFLSTASLLSLAIYFTLNKNGSVGHHISWLPIAATVIYAIAFRFDKGYFPNVIVDKFYPDALKSVGLKLSIFVHVLAAWITIEFYQILKFYGKIDVSLYVFAVLNLVSTVVIKTWITLTEEDTSVKNGCDREEHEGSGLIGNHQVNISTVKENSATAMTIGKGSDSIFKGTFPQLVAVLAGTLTAISDGMQYGWTAPVLPILLGPDSPVKVNKQQGEWLENLLMIGSFSGLSITMYLVDKIGRKRSILLASFVTVCIWILTALAPSVEYIYVARAFAGSAGNMAFVATPMYIAEIAEQKIRGFLSSLIYLMMLFGILLIYSVAPYIPFYAHCVIGGLLAFTELCIFPFMPESPYYLLYKNQPEEAEKSLRRLRAPGVNIEKELEDIKAAVARQKQERGKLQDLILVPSNRKAMIIMAILNGAQHFSSISVLLMNTHSILEAGGSIYVPPDIAAILFAVLMVTAASIASFTIDKFGRRTLLISSSLATGLCLMVLAIYFSLKNSGYNTAPVSWIPVVCIMSYALVFKLGLGMVPIVLTAELFPTKMKAYGMTLADGMYVIASLLSLQVYQRLYDNFGLEYPFYVFSISCYIAAVFTYFFIPETKGRTLEEIQMILKGKNVEDAGKSIDV
ncbi:unnamed protein product [Psylliodes chrysocephalus]|uniref:Major facilitator superfamily (MFS) profile domain-containing protein n=1 Tax=Psylliodes chrysocephalus TaxID=3402493 RepID=A0A9P0G5E9_9CUCU|nr:unnamed protein product [Psylliodes chrysocephala]